MRGSISSSKNEVSPVLSVISCPLGDNKGITVIATKKAKVPAIIVDTYDKPTVEPTSFPELLPRPLTPLAIKKRIIKGIIKVIKLPKIS